MGGEEDKKDEAKQEAKEEDASVVKDEEVKEEEKEEDVKMEEEEEQEEPVPVAELTPEEAQAFFRIAPLVHDIDPSTLADVYADFSLPSKEEGFDEVQFTWQKIEE